MCFGFNFYLMSDELKLLKTAKLRITVYAGSV